MFFVGAVCRQVCLTFRNRPVFFRCPNHLKHTVTILFPCSWCIRKPNHAGFPGKEYSLDLYFIYIKMVNNILWWLYLFCIHNFTKLTMKLRRKLRNSNGSKRFGTFRATIYIYARYQIKSSLSIIIIILLQTIPRRSIVQYMLRAIVAWT